MQTKFNIDLQQITLILGKKPDITELFLKLLLSSDITYYVCLHINFIRFFEVSLTLKFSFDLFMSYGDVKSSSLWYKVFLNALFESNKTIEPSSYGKTRQTNPYPNHPNCDFNEQLTTTKATTKSCPFHRTFEQVLRLFLFFMLNTSKFFLLICTLVLGTFTG
uniref:Uncharacterized protein n=1 Tax=Glossina brevipalpis TaxID=37001 RepID=A0A1A9WM77_9MUSC